MKNLKKRMNNQGYVGIETAIISALLVAFALMTYRYLEPSFMDIAVAIRNSVSGVY